MKILSAAIISTVLLFGGCTSIHPQKQLGQADVEGTWRWISMNQQPVENPFYIRLYSDGSAATWPAPDGWPTTVNGVSHGRYHIDGHSLVIETGRGKGDPKARVEIKGERMILIDENYQVVYHRVVPDLEPGHLGIAPDQ